MDRKTAVMIAVIFAVAIVVSTYVWASYNRYYLVGNGTIHTYKIDRKTGESWHLSPRRERQLK